MRLLPKLFAKKPAPVAPPALPPAYQVHRTLETLPFDRFIQCVDPGDLSALVISGEAPEAVLQAAWAELFLEYLDRNRNNAALLRTQLLREIAVLSSRVNRAETLIYLLTTLPYHIQILPELQAITAELRALGNEDLELDPRDRAGLLAELELAEQRRCSERLDMKVKLVELEAMDAELQSAGSGRRATRQYFTGVLARLAVHKRVLVIRPADITTAEYCDMLTEYLDHQEAQHKTLQKSATHE